MIEFIPIVMLLLLVLIITFGFYAAQTFSISTSEANSDQEVILAHKELQLELPKLIEETLGTNNHSGEESIEVVFSYTGYGDTSVMSSNFSPEQKTSLQYLSYSGTKVKCIFEQPYLAISLKNLLPIGLCLNPKSSSNQCLINPFTSIYRNDGCSFRFAENDVPLVTAFLSQHNFNSIKSCLNNWLGDGIENILADEPFSVDGFIIHPLIMSRSKRKYEIERFKQNYNTLLKTLLQLEPIVEEVPNLLKKNVEQSIDVKIRLKNLIILSLYYENEVQQLQAIRFAKKSKNEELRTMGHILCPKQESKRQAAKNALGSSEFSLYTKLFAIQYLIGIKERDLKQICVDTLESSWQWNFDEIYLAISMFLVCYEYLDGESIQQSELERALSIFINNYAYSSMPNVEKLLKISISKIFELKQISGDHLQRCLYKLYKKNPYRLEGPAFVLLRSRANPLIIQHIHNSTEKDELNFAEKQIILSVRKRDRDKGKKSSEGQLSVCFSKQSEGLLSGNKDYRG